MTALNIIEDFYGNQVTKRSNTKLINHIYEGIKILQALNVSHDTIEAYCLHPLLQTNTLEGINYIKDKGYKNLYALTLAMEYKFAANSYLSYNYIDNYKESEFLEVKDMLIADKVQNYKDFLLYHKDTHPRSKELDQYFNNWFNEILNIDYDNIRNKLPKIGCVGRYYFHNKILLLQRSDDNTWCLPGGKLKGRETADSCILRECQEELGIKVARQKMGDYISQVEGREDYQIIIYNISLGFNPIKLSSEHKKIGYFNLDNLPDNLHYNTKQIIEYEL